MVGRVKLTQGAPQTQWNGPVGADAGKKRTAKGPKRNTAVRKHTILTEVNSGTY